MIALKNDPDLPCRQCCPVPHLTCSRHTKNGPDLPCLRSRQIRRGNSMTGGAAKKSIASFCVWDGIFSNTCSGAPVLTARFSELLTYRDRCADCIFPSLQSGQLAKLGVVFRVWNGIFQRNGPDLPCLQCCLVPHLTCSWHTENGPDLPCLMFRQLGKTALIYRALCLDRLDGRTTCWRPQGKSINRFGIRLRRHFQRIATGRPGAHRPLFQSIDIALPLR